MSEASIAQMVWDGQLPVKLVSAGMASNAPPPLFLMASRLSYFPFLLQRFNVLKHMTPSPASALAPAGASAGSASSMAASTPERPVWLECRASGAALAWHLPIGLQHDVLVARMRSVSGAEALREVARGVSKGASPIVCDADGPWEIVVHFEAFPDSAMARMDSLERLCSDGLAQHVQTSWKEAFYMRHGSTAKMFANFSRDSHLAMWNAVLEHNRAVFTTVREQLLLNDDQVVGTALRLHLPGRPSVLARVSPFAAGAGSEQTTLGSVLAELWPHATRLEAIAHGIVLDLAAPLHALSAELSYLDNFLHVVVVQDPLPAGAEGD